MKLNFYKINSKLMNFFGINSFIYRYIICSILILFDKQNWFQKYRPCYFFNYYINFSLENKLDINLLEYSYMYFNLKGDKLNYKNFYNLDFFDYGDDNIFFNISRQNKIRLIGFYYDYLIKEYVINKKPVEHSYLFKTFSNLDIPIKDLNTSMLTDGYSIFVNPKNPTYYIDLDFSNLKVSEVFVETYKHFKLFKNKFSLKTHKNLIPYEMIDFLSPETMIDFLDMYKENNEFIIKSLKNLNKNELYSFFIKQAYN